MWWDVIGGEREEERERGADAVDAVKKREREREREKRSDETQREGKREGREEGRRTLFWE